MVLELLLHKFFVEIMRRNNNRLNAQEISFLMLEELKHFRTDVKEEIKQLRETLLLCVLAKDKANYDVTNIHNKAKDADCDVTNETSDFYTSQKDIEMFDARLDENSASSDEIVAAQMPSSVCNDPYKIKMETPYSYISFGEDDKESCSEVVGEETHPKIMHVSSVGCPDNQTNNQRNDILQDTQAVDSNSLKSCKNELQRSPSKFYLAKKEKNEHSAVMYYECGSCHLKFNSRSEMQQHVEDQCPSAKSYQCKLCGKSFQQKGGFLSHWRNHTGERPFHCKLCDKTFKQKGHLQGHIKTHSDTFVCHICEYAFFTKQELTIHEDKHIRKTKIKSFKCRICKSTCSSEQQLKRHVTHHPSTKPHQHKGAGASKKFNSTFRR